jgi:hypothetical protein
MHTGLERVLMCYVCYRPDVGYVQVRTLLLGYSRSLSVVCGRAVCGAALF